MNTTLVKTEKGLERHQAEILSDLMGVIYSLDSKKKINEKELRKMMERNPHYLQAVELEPGYRIVYPMGQTRIPEYLLRIPQKPLS